MWVFQVDSSITTLVLTDLISYLYQTTIIYANNIKVNCYTIWNLNYWNKNEKSHKLTKGSNISQWYEHSHCTKQLPNNQVND